MEMKFSRRYAARILSISITNASVHARCTMIVLTIDASFVYFEQALVAR